MGCFHGTWTWEVSLKLVSMAFCSINLPLLKSLITSSMLLNNITCLYENNNLNHKDHSHSLLVSLQNPLWDIISSDSPDAIRACQKARRMEIWTSDNRCIIICNYHLCSLVEIMPQKTYWKLIHSSILRPNYWHTLTPSVFTQCYFEIYTTLKKVVRKLRYKGTMCRKNFKSVYQSKASIFHRLWFSLIFNSVFKFKFLMSSENVNARLIDCFWGFFVVMQWIETNYLACWEDQLTQSRPVGYVQVQLRSWNEEYLKQIQLVVNVELEIGISRCIFIRIQRSYFPQGISSV